MKTNTEISAATELQSVLERPIYNRTLGKNVGAGGLDYEVYLKTRALYSLQTSTTELSVPDELLFQTLHQAQELWLKTASSEVVTLVDALDRSNFWKACECLDRVTKIMWCMASEIRVLETLSPEAYQVIRRNLGNGSGLESPGYNRLLVAAEAAEAGFDRALDRNGVDPAQLYLPTSRHVESTDALKRVAELMLDWDDAFQTWLFAHFMLVRRTIGVSRSVRALDGVPTHVLTSRMTKPLFPKLWDARLTLTQCWNRDGGHAVGAPRSPVPARPEAPAPTSPASAES